jgi:hypothetical protein
VKNYSVTFERYGSEAASTIMSKTYVEDFRGVEQIQWQPHHVVFNFDDGTVIAVLATRIVEIVSYED